MTKTDERRLTKNGSRLIITLASILFLLQVIATFISGISNGSTSFRSSVFVSFLLSAVIGALDMFSVRYLLSAVKRSERAYVSQMSVQLESSLESYRNQGVREEELIRQIGAEINEELHAAQEALLRGDLSRINHHLKTSLTLASQSKSIACDNIYISAVLEIKLRQCAEAGIVLNTQVNLPCDLPIQSIEVASIFFNLIDNAMRECELLSESGDTDERLAINVRGLVQASELFVEVDNPCRASVDYRQRAAKRRVDTSGIHGWGTQIVADIARKHDGISTFSERDGEFIAQVMLPLPQE